MGFRFNIWVLLNTHYRHQIVIMDPPWLSSNLHYWLSYPKIFPNIIFCLGRHILETAGSAEKFQWQISPNFPLLYHSPNLRYYFCENFPIISPKSSTSVPDGRRVIGKQASIGKIKTRPADIIISIINQDTRLGICQMFYISNIIESFNFTRKKTQHLLLIHFEQIVTFCIQIQTNSNYFVKTYNNSCPNLLN